MKPHLPVIALACIASLPLVGCADSGEAQTVEQVRQRYAEQFVSGMDYGLSGRIKARAIDPATNDLLDVSIEEIDKRILHADRGEIIVDPVANTISIRLIGVTSADVESGVLDTAPMYLTEAIKLGYDVTE